MKTPVRWVGSKSRLSAHIIQHFPPHTTYCEPFGGSAAVLLAKEPSKVEIYNDLDKRLVNFFRVLRSPELCGQLQDAAAKTLYSRSEFELAAHPCEEPVESARRFLVRHRLSFGGKGLAWSYAVSTSRKGMAATTSRWSWCVESLTAIHARLQNVQIECDDWRNILQRYDSADTLFYLDPPYHPATRVSGGYKHELVHADHADLIASLLTIRGAAVLSGYAHDSYARLERAGWKRLEYTTRAHASGRITKRTECLWLSPAIASGKSRSLCLTPKEKMSQGAHHAHKVMVRTTTQKLQRAIARLREQGKKPTATRLARITKMSREHISRNYRHLLEMEKV